MSLGGLFGPPKIWLRLSWTLSLHWTIGCHMATSAYNPIWNISSKNMQWAWTYLLYLPVPLYTSLWAPCTAGFLFTLWTWLQWTHQPTCKNKQSVACCSPPFMPESTLMIHLSPFLNIILSLPSSELTRTSKTLIKTRYNHQEHFRANIHFLLSLPCRSFPPSQSSFVPPANKATYHLTCSPDNIFGLWNSEPCLKIY